jgi:hypothetical protein
VGDLARIALFKLGSNVLVVDCDTQGLKID